MMSPTSRPTTTGRRTLLLILGGALLVAFGWIVSGESLEAQADTPAAKPTESQPVAQIEGAAITRAELEKEAASILEELEIERRAAEVQYAQKRSAALEQTLEAMIRQRLVEREAEARGVSAEQLVAEEAKAEPVTAGDVDAFYEDLKTQRQGVPPKEQIASQIESFLAQQRESEARDAFFGRLETKYRVERHLEAPRVELDTADLPAKGPADAPVTIVEFSDFQCPYCARVVPVLDRVKATYGDKVRIVFRHFPIHSIHPNAQKAAEASLCAEAQGKFWEMHDLLFAEQQQLAVPDLKAKAEKLALDGGEFARCLDTGEYADQVREDLVAGRVAGVEGTPALFLNGRPVPGGAVPYEQLAQMIDAELD